LARRLGTSRLKVGSSGAHLLLRVHRRAGAMAAVGDPSGPHPCPLAGPRPFTGLSEHSSGEERGTKRASKLGNGRRGRVPPKERSISRVKTCRGREQQQQQGKGNEQWLSAIFPAFSRACTVPDGMAARAHTRHTTAALPSRPSYGDLALQCINAPKPNKSSPLPCLRSTCQSLNLRDCHTRSC
jgi:hypothetical protein